MKWNCKNIIVKPSFNQWWRELMCKWFGCSLYGPYYGMSQSHCPDCGKKTRFAQENSFEWSEPYS